MFPVGIVKDFTRFSRDSFNADLSNVDWNALLDKKSCDVIIQKTFNKLINKHAPKPVRKQFQTVKPNSCPNHGLPKV